MKEQTLAVQRMQDYIAEHLEEEITLAQLAEQSLFSPWHSYRLFRAYTGLSPAAYIRRLRLTRSARRVILKRGVKADNYFPYCDEVGCDVWGLLTSMDSLCGEPVCLWLPAKYKKPNTSTYVQGVEVPAGQDGPVPEGFDVIDLPAAEYLMFQSEPFREENYAQTILGVQQAMDRYSPALIGCEWDDENPRIQLEPRGERGYIELRAVKPLSGR